jgi:hypothetical protein
MAHISAGGMNQPARKSSFRDRDNSTGSATADNFSSAALNAAAAAIPGVDPPTNDLVCAMLTDFYQISMTYAQWKNGKVEDHAVYDLFFRKPPFQGELCVSTGSNYVGLLMLSL